MLWLGHSTGHTRFIVCNVIAALTTTPVDVVGSHEDSSAYLSTEVFGVTAPPTGY
jgi:hypothetical protein